MTDNKGLVAEYVKTAEELLTKEFGDKMNPSAVEKLATYLIEQDIEQAAAREKVAELDESGRVIARAFVDELNKLQS